MIGAQHLVVLFLGIEILSIPLFVLAGSEKDDLFGNEASLKYFLMGAFSTAIFLLGAAFLYGGTGTLYFHEMLLRTSFSEHFGEFPILVKAGLILVSVGLLFKVSAVPFHFWSPDVYEGSPNRIAAFMAIVVKIAGFAAFAQFLASFAPMQAWYATWMLPVSIITVLAGNIVALVQTSYKRMLAYSSISHAGYLLLFLLTPIQENFQVLGIYLLSYGLGTAVLFYLFDKYSQESDKSVNIFTGIVQKSKLDTIAMVVATFAVAGIPSTIGFIAKYQLFTAAFNTAMWGVLLGLVGSAISISYYFKPFRVMFRTDSETAPKSSFGLGDIFLLGIVLAIVLLGIAPVILNWIF
jgi:NADH-quinone oxidoreductase subunit N